MVVFFCFCFFGPKIIKYRACVASSVAVGAKANTQMPVLGAVSSFPFTDDE